MPLIEAMNVLVLTDLSEVAKNAGSYAVQFLSGIPVHFYLLNIRLFHPGEPEGAHHHTRQLALGKLNQRVAELKELTTNKEHEFSVIYSEDNLVGAARKFVDEKKIDLIVMGAANKGHSPNTIIGNHTFEMITKIKCNILAVAENTLFRIPRKIIFPLDSEIAVDRKSFSMLKQPGIAENASLMVVEVCSDRGININSNFQHDLKEEFNNRQVDIKRLEKSEAFSRESLMVLQKQFDLIVLLGKNINICGELLHTKQGLYSKVVNELPILVLHR